MKWSICVCLMLVYLNRSWAKNENYNFTYGMASRCKEHICRHGYSYDTFYHIDESHLQHATVKKDKTDLSYFEMHIAIQAASNGHILLSSVQNPGPNDPVYEIVVGGGGNRFTELRLNLKRNARGSAKTPNILSTIDFTAFYIKISDEGLVEFGKEGESLPIISYYDVRELPIKYFSFASWTGVEAKFLYDCPTSDDDMSTPNSQVVEPKLSNSDELKRNLLMAKLPSVPPSPTVQVQLSVRATHVKYDIIDSKLKIRLAVVMSWTDNSMVWSPTKYNETSSLKFRQGQIWRPTFFIFNSDSSEPLDTQNPDLISVVYSGDATFHFQTEAVIWCFDVNETLRWPRDSHTCTLVIEPWEVHEKIVIDVMDDKDNKLAVFAGVDEVIESEWEMVTSQMVVKPSVWTPHTNDNETNNSDRYLLTVELKRRPTTYNIAFYTPLSVLIVFVLMSFWTDPLEVSRVWFYVGCTVAISMGLCNIDHLVPTHIVPHIMVLYITLLCGVLMAMMVKVSLVTPYAEKLCKSSFVQGLLTFSLLRIIFCLPSIKISLGYSRQEDDAEFQIPDNGRILEGSNEDLDKNDDARRSRRELAEVLDKFMFIAYSITAAAVLADHY